MRHCRHLSAEERDRIAGMYARHEGVSAIAAAIGRNKSTVSREIARNGRDGRYGAIAAQSRSDARREACRPRKRLSDPALAAEVRRRIVVYLSMKKSTLCYVDNRHFDSDHADRFTRGRGRHVTTAPAC